MPNSVRNYITPIGYAHLQKELEHLVRVERPRVVEVVAWAASNGDRSENGDYIYGKKRLREIDRRIRFLTHRLDVAEVVDSSNNPSSGQIFFGAKVTVLDECGVEHTYTIVGVDEIHMGSGYISWVSPLARALMKHREGDCVCFQSPSGLREIEVLKIAYEVIGAET